FVVCVYLFWIRLFCVIFFFFSSRRRHTRFSRDWSSDVCSSDLVVDDDLRLAGDGGGVGLDVVAELLAGLADIELRVVVDGLDEAVIALDGRVVLEDVEDEAFLDRLDRKSTRLNSSHVKISYAVLCL